MSAFGLFAHSWRARSSRFFSSLASKARGNNYARVFIALTGFQYRFASSPIETLPHAE
jgi:hypothetical protein